MNEAIVSLQSGPPNVARSCGRLVFIANGLGPGGAERQLVYLSLGLRERGWDVLILTLTPVVHHEFAQRLRDAGIGVISLQSAVSASATGLGRAFWAALREVKATRPEVLIGFLAHGSLFARVVGRLAAVPRIITSLRSTHSRRPWHDTLLALTRHLDHRVVTNSEVAAQAQLRARVTTSGKSVVIANGFDVSRVQGRSAVTRRSDHIFGWLSIAGFRPEKGHAVLIRAAKIVADKSPIKLMLAGDGPELERMKALARELDIEDSVEFLGNRDDIGALIRSADAFVLSSSQEGLPNAMIEALAGGLPVVSTDVGGCRGLIEPGNSGFLVPSNDAAKLAAAMLRLMEVNPDIRRAMGERGRQHILDSFSMEGMIDRWAALLEQPMPDQR